MFKILAKINKILLPSFTKQGLDISKAKKWQMAIIGYRAYVTKRALEQFRKKILILTFSQPEILFE